VRGNGPVSDSVSAAIADKPAAASLITKNMAQSSKTSLAIEWNAVSVNGAHAPGSEILGYVLHITDPVTGSTWEAFNGVTLGLKTQIRANVLGLVTGKAYDFEVVAWNFNGVGTLSSTYSFYSCILPTGFIAPTRSTSTASSITIDWSTPADTGGCSISGYAVFKNDGAGGSTFTEANSASDAAIRNQPGLNSAAITTFVGADLGHEFIIYVQAFTVAGDSIVSE